MKHPVAAAVLAGFTGALGSAIENKDISAEKAAQYARFAVAIAKELLKGRVVLGKTLGDFQDESERMQQIVESEKVNLQQWGD